MAKNENYIGLKHFPENKENPFMSKLVIPVKSKTHAVATSRTEAIVNTVTGETKEDALFLATKKVVDSEEFVKIYINHICGLFNLSKAGQALFTYIAKITQFNDTIMFRIDDCKKFTGYSSTTVIYKGLSELLENEFIAKTDIINVFYINPQIFYKGDRLVIVKEYRRKKLEKNKTPENQLDIFNSEKKEQ